MRFAGREGLPKELAFFNKTHELWLGRIAMCVSVMPAVHRHDRLQDAYALSLLALPLHKSQLAWWPCPRPCRVMPFTFDSSRLQAGIQWAFVHRDLEGRGILLRSAHLAESCV